MSESVEQAALRRAAEPPIDWKARANREAAVILAECDHGAYSQGAYERLVGLLSIAWLQGAIYGSHETLGKAEVAFENLRAAL